VKACHEWVEDKFKGMLFDRAVQYLIVGINFILRMIIIYLCCYIGKATETGKTKLITDGVFVVQFLNTAILLLLVNADLAPQGWLFSNMKGNIADFNREWY